VLRNVAEPVEIFAVVRLDETADHLAIDPVCQMAVDPERAVSRLLLDAKAYYFCSLTCASGFAQHRSGTPNSGMAFWLVILGLQLVVSGGEQPDIESRRAHRFRRRADSRNWRPEDSPPTGYDE
jgi:YHS domain-containing protein